MRRIIGGGGGTLALLAGSAVVATVADIALAQGTQTPSGHEGHHGTPAAEAPVREAPQKGVKTTIVGEVIDPACYIEAGIKSVGPGHFQCAVDCAKSGQTLAIL